MHFCLENLLRRALSGLLFFEYLSKLQVVSLHVAFFWEGHPSGRNPTGVYGLQITRFYGQFFPTVSKLPFLPTQEILDFSVAAFILPVLLNKVNASLLFL